jgi:hypothetical protein
MKISVLISARRNSKYLAKFLFGLFDRTYSLDNIEVLVMLNEHDTWNDELVRHFSDMPNVWFFRENMRLGRAGLHEYFNELAKHAAGDWLIYFCEDHFITIDNWDKYIFDHVEKLELDPLKVWCLIPKFDNCGAMNQIISRGYYEALGKKVGRHGWIDSYLNDVNVAIPERVVKFDDEMFHDFTHDQPSPMSEAHCQSVSTSRGKDLPAYTADIVKAKINEDQAKLRKVIDGGG